MRLIDADEIRDEVDRVINWNTNDEYNIYSDVMNIIDDSPTIETNSWISVDDMLPNEETYILVSNSQRVTIAYYANRIFIGVQGKPHTLKTVTHWMPLPKPPMVQT